MNPNASEFVPSFLKKSPAPAATPAANPTPTPAPAATTPPQPKKEEPKPKAEEKKETPKAEKKASETAKPAPAKKQEKEYEPTEEEIARELKKMAEEDGEEMASEESLGQLVDEEAKEHVNLVFIGHVDAGKSTLSGQILYVSGQVDKRTIEKYEREAKQNNRESWFLAYIMDTNEEERKKGKTVEVGRAYFETPQKRYTILDAPGHKNYVPNMIGGAQQADIAVLVISARKGEFESGFTKGGQTREHAMLAKTLGVRTLIIAINKLDDCDWDKGRYDEIVNALTPYLKTVGYNMKNDAYFLPISAQKGSNIKDKFLPDVCPWYQGPSLFEMLDNIKPVERLAELPLRIPLIDKIRDAGKVWVYGKIETGKISKGDSLLLMPGKIPVEVGEVANAQRSLKTARAGESVRVSLKGVEEDQVHQGFVLCDAKQPVPCQAKIVAQVAIMDLLPHKAVFTSGYTAVLHVHTAVEECTVLGLLESIDKKTGTTLEKKPKFAKNGGLVRCVIEASQPVCIELFSDFPQLGRFTLRDEGKTIAVGKITALGPSKPKSEATTTTTTTTTNN